MTAPAAPPPRLDLENLVHQAVALAEQARADGQSATMIYWVFQNLAEELERHWPIHASLDCEFRSRDLVRARLGRPSVAAEAKARKLLGLQWSSRP